MTARRLLVSALLATLPPAGIALAATPAQAYECSYALSDDITIDCNACPKAERLLDKYVPTDCLQ